MTVGIVIALTEELNTLTSIPIEPGCCVLISEHVWIAHSGAGRDNAQRAAEQLIAHGATRLISWGCAAALSPGLKPGDLILANCLLDANHLEIKMDSSWQTQTQQLLTRIVPVYEGCLLESLELVTTHFAKQQLYKTTNAIAVDMESIAIAKVAKQHLLPFLAIRTIADPVTMDLPKAIAHSVNAQGCVILKRLLIYLLLHPQELPSLIQLGLHFNAAKKTLKKIATQLNTILAFPN